MGQDVWDVVQTAERDAVERQRVGTWLEGEYRSLGPIRLITDGVRVKGESRPHLLVLTDSTVAAVTTRETGTLFRLASTDVAVSLVGSRQIAVTRMRGGRNLTLVNNFTSRKAFAATAAVLRGQDAGLGGGPTSVGLGSFVLGSCRFLGGHGLALSPKTPGSLVFNRERVAFLGGRESVNLPADSLTDVAFGGPGAWSSRKSFWGVGFGPVGVDLVLLGAMLSALSAKSGITTVVRLTTRDSAGFWEHRDRYTPDALKIALSWLTAEVENRRRSAQAQSRPAVPGPSLATEIGKLAELHAVGALTDEEFTAAKARLLEPR